MGRVICGTGEIEVLDGQFIAEACEDLGVPFGCRSGACGTCETEVVAGMDNLSPLTPEEKEFGLEEGSTRLICQCILKSGDVTLNIE